MLRRRASSAYFDPDRHLKDFYSYTAFSILGCRLYLPYTVQQESFAVKLLLFLAYKLRSDKLLHVSVVYTASEPWRICDMCTVATLFALSNRML
jgi:hypothetical protein